MSGYDFGSFPNVTISGIDISSLNEDELAVLHAQAEYCQAMTDADTYGARGRYCIKGTHHYDLRDGRWILVSR